METDGNGDGVSSNPVSGMNVRRPNGNDDSMAWSPGVTNVTDVWGDEFRSSPLAPNVRAKCKPQDLYPDPLGFPFSAQARTVLDNCLFLPAVVRAFGSEGNFGIVHNHTKYEARPGLNSIELLSQQAMCTLTREDRENAVKFPTSHVLCSSNAAHCMLRESSVDRSKSFQDLLQSSSRNSTVVQLCPLHDKELIDMQFQQSCEKDEKFQEKMEFCIARGTSAANPSNHLQLYPQLKNQLFQFTMPLRSEDNLKSKQHSVSAAYVAAGGVIRVKINCKKCSASGERDIDRIGFQDLQVKKKDQSVTSGLFLAFSKAESDFFTSFRCELESSIPFEGCDLRLEQKHGNAPFWTEDAKNVVLIMSQSSMKLLSTQPAPASPYYHQSLASLPTLLLAWGAESSHDCGASVTRGRDDTHMSCDEIDTDDNHCDKDCEPVANQWNEFIPSTAYVASHNPSAEPLEHFSLAGSSEFEMVDSQVEESSYLAAVEESSIQALLAD